MTKGCLSFVVTTLLAIALSISSYVSGQAVTGYGGGSSAVSNPFDLTSLVMREPFLSSGATATQIGVYGVSTSSTGGYTWTQTVGPDFNHTTMTQLGLGANSESCYYMTQDSAAGSQNLKLGGLNTPGAGQAELGGMFQTTTVANIHIRVGFTSSATYCSNADPVANGVYLKYDTGTPDTNWKLVAVAGGTATTVDTGVPVVVNNWYILRLYINAANTWHSDITRAGFSTVTSTVSTNLPATDFVPQIYAKALSVGGATLNVAPPFVVDVTGRIVP